MNRRSFLKNLGLIAAALSVPVPVWKSKSMNFDTLTITSGGGALNNVERSFTKWGFARDGVRGQKFNFKPDKFSAKLPLLAASSDPVFPFECQVVVRTGRVSADGSDGSFSGGVIKFTGKRHDWNARVTSENKHYHDYEFLGPWYDLANTHYLQNFKGSVVNPYSPGETILNTGLTPTGTLLFISVGDQIQSILQWLLDQYTAQGMAAPFQYAGRALTNGTIDLSVNGQGAVGVNSDKAGNQYVKQLVAQPTIDAALYSTFLVSYIAKPMMCSQALQKCLELSPRTNISFDYSTTPPTVYVRSIDNFAPVNLALFNGVDHKSVNIKRRDDLVARAVVITYRITNTVQGKQVIDYAIDKWGANGYNSPLDPSAGLRVINETIDLQGFNTSFTVAALKTFALGCIGGNQASKRAWWTDKRGGEVTKFEDSRVRFQKPDPNNPPPAVIATTIPDAKIYYAADGFDSTGAPVVAQQEFTAADYAFFTNRIYDGTHHSWMSVNGAPVLSVKAVVKSPMQFAEYDATSPSGLENDTTGNCVRRHNPSDQTHVNAELTNGITGTYETTSSSTPGELFIQGPGGIAQYLFNALQKFQYDGEFVKVESDFANNVNLTNAINFTNGRAEWTFMNAQPQSIIEDYGTKETSVQIGVVNHLSAGQLSSLLNMWAFRRPWYNPALRADNTVASSGQVSMPVTAGHANTTEGLENEGKKTNTDYQSQPAGAQPGVIAGQLNHDPTLITSILANANATPADGFSAADLKVMQPRECAFCDASGATVHAIVHTSGFYTKP